MKSLVNQLVPSLRWVQLFASPWTAARQASLSITNSWSSRKLTAIPSVIPSNYLIPCRPLLLPPSVFPSIRVTSIRGHWDGTGMGPNPTAECLLSCFSRVQLLETLWTVDPQGSSVHGILQARILEWAAISFSRGSSPPRD